MTLALLASREPEVTIKLAGREFTIARARLGVYFKLETLRREQPSPNTIREYLRLCGVVTQPADPAVDIIRTFIVLVELNRFDSQLPMYVRPQRGDGSEQPWDYQDRWATHWVHNLAYHYGWSREEILNLPVDEAAAYLQELAVEHQMQAEWQHRLSPNSWSYDKSSNSNKFEPLVRPRWMQPQQPEQPKGPSSIPEDLRPVGPVVTAQDIISRLSH